MSQNKLHRVILKVFLLNFSDDPLKVNYHDHFIFVTGSAAKIHPAAFKLEDPLRLRLHELRVIDELGEPLRSIFDDRLTALAGSMVMMAGEDLILLQLLLLQLTFAELDQFALQCLADLDLRERLLSRAQMYALHITVIDEGLCEG